MYVSRQIQTMITTAVCDQITFNMNEIVSFVVINDVKVLPVI
jgi:hypothetical protein